VGLREKSTWYASERGGDPVPACDNSEPVFRKASWTIPVATDAIRLWIDEFRNRYTGIVRERPVSTALDCSDFSMLSDMRDQIETPGMDSRCSLIQRTGEDFYLASGRAARSKTFLAKMLYNENSFRECYAIDGLFCQRWMPLRWRSKSTQGGAPRRRGSA
jgi:hypothetical protein